VVPLDPSGAGIDGGVVAAWISGAVGLIGAAGGVLVQMRSSDGTVATKLRNRATTAEEDAEKLREELTEANDLLVDARREVTRLRLVLADHGIDPGGST
jgi:acetyl-CoA carboxylase carboxyltransferase component